jgi:vacuolar-type H+-ATPase subunit H
MSENTEGPTLHLIVEQQRIGALTDRMKKNTSQILDEAKVEAREWLGKAVAEAYREGLRDGFAQGCIAESKSRAGASS